MDRGASILNVRNATRDDIEALVSLRIQLLEATDPSFDGALRAWLRTHLADGSFRAWIADDAGTVVAASGLTVLDRPPYPGNATGLDGYVTNMYTLPAYRRRGLARQLLEVLIAHARQVGIKRLFLESSREGQQLYEEFGFQLTRGMELTL
ncbi:MAG TPA: GNAT family N-acetyltransferase [Candidatus Eisenbacteria bacterium]|nr:GNAT family N-acetyltransferase [Candidatus Eisenbacteria bacterium]